MLRFSTMCKELMQALEQEIQQDEPDIIQEANAICDKITGENPFFDSICKQIVDEYIESVIDDLKNQDDPQKICAKIDLC